MINAILGVRAKIAAFGLAVLSLVVFGAKQRRKGKLEERQRNKNAHDKAVTTAEAARGNVDEIIDDLPSGGASKQLHTQWGRD